MVPFTFTPIRVAAPRSSDTASMAWPAFVLLIKVVSPIMITIQETIVTRVSPVTVMAPSANFRAGIVTTEVKDFVSAPNKRRATFCNK